MPQEIILKKVRVMQKSGEKSGKLNFLPRKTLNVNLIKNSKSVLATRNPRQQLQNFQRQIVVYANLFMNYRKKQQKQKIIEQRARIDAYFIIKNYFSSNLL
ncbi:hypothetical protein [Candidatus Arsenophonus triatominarum]|uniref:hypothetical protein n=1 Tax=Candidatus Arsenophonus triatominarum TaxID=57911 RepID=UPI000A8B9A39|nr:hypothetical protein [Candidatus Arsenophonus triatominarum]